MQNYCFSCESFGRIDKKLFKVNLVCRVLFKPGNLRDHIAMFYNFTTNQV